MGRASDQVRWRGALAPCSPEPLADMASPLSMGSIHSAKPAPPGGCLPRSDPARKLIRLSPDLEQALLLVMKYVAHTTGTEPRQEEIAAVLKSYFTLDEVTNQLNYLRKKPAENPSARAFSGFQRTGMRINMIGASQMNCLARAGFFIRPVADAIETIRRHARARLGAPPSDASIALSLRSSFILSELKNQIMHSRNPLQDLD
jgi:hypothetical protein